MPYIRVAILEDHQSVIDGHRYRLEKLPGFQVTVVAYTGRELEEELAAAHKAGTPANILLMDVAVKAAPGSETHYPVLHAIPKLIDLYPRMPILIVSATESRAQIEATINAGASGYLVKGDAQAFVQLGAHIQAVRQGGLYLSPTASTAMYRKRRGPDPMPALSRRELQALSLCAAYPGRRQEDLAHDMNVSHSTVRNTLHHVYTKLGVNGKTEAILKAQMLGMLPPNGVNHMDGGAEEG